MHALRSKQDKLTDQGTRSGNSQSKTKQSIKVKKKQNLLFPDHEARRDTVDGLDKVHTISAVIEQVVDVHVLDVQRVDPHAKHAFLSVEVAKKGGRKEKRKIIKENKVAGRKRYSADDANAFTLL